MFTECIEHADIAISNGRIAGIGSYEGETEIDCSGRYVAPGFIDGHIHLESSMLKPVEFVKTVLSHGTTAVVADPHEIANVCGQAGIDYMLAATQGLPVDIWFALPSCVPSTSFDESGCILRAEDLRGYYKHDRVIGLAEVMDYMGTIRGDEDILHKIADARRFGRIIDGHAPGLQGRELCAYVYAGIHSDHECISFDEAREKLKLGQWIMVREGTAARNLEALMGIFRAPYYQRALLVTDDKHPHDLLEHGHIDDILRKAVRLGADPCIAVRMATWNAASCFGLKDTGAVAPGYKADLVILSDLKDMKVDSVIKGGRLAADNREAYIDNCGSEKVRYGRINDGRAVIPMVEPFISRAVSDPIYHSFHCRELTDNDFIIPETGTAEASGTAGKTAAAAGEKAMEAPAEFRIIQFVKDEIVTREIRSGLTEGKPEVSVRSDILKLAAVERHHNTNHVGIGFVNGYGLQQGAIASSVSHDSHNIIVVGTSDSDMAAAANAVRSMQGGWAIALEGRVIASLPLPIAGLMSELDAGTLACRIKEIKAIARSLGVKEGIDPFMTLAFVSLPVIPEIRLLTTGLYNTRQQRIVSVYV